MNYASHGEVYASRQSVSDARRARRDKKLGDHITSQIVSGRIPFPYKRTFTSEAEVHSWFRLLQKEAPAFDTSPYAVHAYYSPDLDIGFLSLPTPGSGSAPPPPSPPLPPPSVLQLSWFDSGRGYLRIPFNKSLHLKCAAITDYFTEAARMRSFRLDEKDSPLALFRDPRKASACVAKAMRKYGEVSQFSLRHGIFGNISGCNVFKPEVARVVYDAFCAPRVLDISAGWGDRLIGAIASSTVTRYLAFDPNTSLKPGHDEIVSTLSPLRKEVGAPEAVFEVRYSPFESGHIDADEQFDLVFTSPPFFDLEIYQSANPDDHQSSSDYPTFDGWMTHFLFRSMAKAWSHLKPFGHMVIYINDIKTRKICHPMLKYASESLPDVTFVGVLGLAGEGRNAKTRPCWVWRKGPGDSGLDDKEWTSLPVYQVLRGAASSDTGAGAGAGTGAGAGAGADVGAEPTTGDGPAIPRRKKPSSAGPSTTGPAIVRVSKPASSTPAIPRKSSSKPSASVAIARVSKPVSSTPAIPRNDPKPSASVAIARVSKPTSSTPAIPRNDPKPSASVAIARVSKPASSTPAIPRKSSSKRPPPSTSPAQPASSSPAIPRVSKPAPASSSSAPAIARVEKRRRVEESDGAAALAEG